ncbi:MAG: carbohydrate binding domain-containing protein [Hyphomonadaceae bacterium]|nr:carbohydrate binding domain-containing protein [Hyphomonadaceae bacterium]
MTSYGSANIIRESSTNNAKVILIAKKMSGNWARRNREEKPMKTVKSVIAMSTLAAALAFAPTAFSDPNFEVEPVSHVSVPGDLLHNPLAIKWNPEGGNKRVSIVEAEGVPGGQAIQFQIRRRNIKEPWNIRMRAPYEQDVSKGEQIEIYFWARAEKIPRGKDAGRIGVVLGRNVEPYDTVINQEIMPGEDWKMYKVSGLAESDFKVSESDMGFDLAFEKQTIQLGPFFAVTRGASTE